MSATMEISVEMRRRNCYTMLSADLHPMDELPTPEEIYERVHQTV